MSFPSPHGPEDSAPQYSNMFFNVTRHRTPSYDFAPNPDKQWILRWLGKMKPIHHKFTDMLMTKRLQTLQSVDEAVEKVFSELVALNQLDNTYIFYTSDHGYHLGQFGLIKGGKLLFLFFHLSEDASKLLSLNISHTCHSECRGINRPSTDHVARCLLLKTIGMVSISCQLDGCLLIAHVSLFSTSPVLICI